MARGRSTSAARKRKAPAAVLDSEPAPEQSTQVREVRNPRCGAGHPEYELERAEKDHEDARLHRDRREYQHDHAPRKIHPEGEQQTGKGRGSAQRRHGCDREVTPLGVRSRPAQRAYLTRIRAMRDFSPLQFANLWQTCLASPSGLSENFSAKRASPDSCPGCTRLSCHGCLEFSNAM